MANKANTQQTLPIPTNNPKINFSFEYYDKQSTKYCISCWTAKQIRDSLLQLQDICTKSFNDLTRESRVYHFQEVIWEKTIEKGGFPNPAIKNLPAFHFALIGVNNQLARVYGVYSRGTFYIVWFDLNHTIWPVALKHT